jgi:hypothetical protein
MKEAAMAPANGRHAKGKNRALPKGKSSSSSFAQHKQNNTAVPAEQGTRTFVLGSNSSHFAGITKGSRGFGAPSTPDMPSASSIDPTRDLQRHRSSGYSSSSNWLKSTVPVDDAKSVNSYHDRHEKVRVIQVFLTPL